MTKYKIKTSCKLKDNRRNLKPSTVFWKVLELRSISGVSKQYLIKQGIKSRTGKMFSLLGIKETAKSGFTVSLMKTHGNTLRSIIQTFALKKPKCFNKYGLLTYNKRDYRKKNAPRQGMDKWIVAIPESTRGVFPMSKSGGHSEHLEG
ncbi:MAG: hypothetical protein ACLVD8_06385 [Enterocloster sp.]|uniref:hypothetical protein n=1 Tax=Enterocloster sp. TaxID=2719315 RepID=UPI00399B9B9E